MNASIFDELSAEWHDDEQRIAGWFHRHACHAATTSHHGDTITTSDPPAQPPPGDLMSVPDAVAALKANLETSLNALTDALGNDVPGLENIGQQIDSSRLIQAAVAADTVVPQAVLDAEAATLEALASAFAPVAMPVPAVPAVPDVPVPDAPAEPGPVPAQ